MKVIDFVKQNKSLAILFFVVISIFVVGVIGNNLIDKEIKNWPDTIDARTKLTEEKSINYLDGIQKKLINEKNLIASELRKIDTLTFDKIENAFSKTDLSENVIAVLSKNNLLFWNTKYVQKISSDDTLKFGFNETYFLKSRIYTYLLIKDTIKTKNAYFLLGKIVEKEYALNPTYFKEVSLQKDLSQKIKIECSINYFVNNVKNKDGRKYSFDIKNNKAKKIGSVTFVKQTRENAVQQLKDNIFVIQSLLVLLGYLLLAFVVFRKIKNHKSLVLKFLLITIYFSLFRYLLIFLNFPRSFLTTDLLNDKIYFSEFGYGLANSPIELFFTLFSALIIFYFAFRYTFQYSKSIVNRKKSKLLFLIAFPIILLFYLISLRGFSASIRSMVFDTSLRYFQSPSLNFDLPYLVMHINALIMGLISIFGSVALILILIKIFKDSFQNKLNLFFIISLPVFIAFIFIYTNIQITPQNTVFIKCLHAVLVFTLVFVLQHYEFQGLTRIITFCLIASVISIMTLLFYNSELEKESLKTTANVISRVNDRFYKRLISETLLDDFSRAKALEAFKNKGSNFNAYAFMIWSKSHLQKESLNSSVNFLDLNGNLLGGFGSIYPKVSISKVVDTNTVIEEIQIFEEKLDNENQKLLRGIFPIKDEYAFLGYLDVSILYDLNDFGFNTQPEFITSGKLNARAILKLDKLSILDYRDKVLKLVYGDINPSTELNEKILNTKLSEKNDAWLDTEFNGSEYVIYIKKIKMNNFDRVLAVALRGKELTISLFDFFKVFFTHLILLILIVITYVLVVYDKGKKYRFDLRTNLLLAFLIISLIPLILTAFYLRGITANKNEEATYLNLGKKAFTIENYLANHLPNQNNNNVFADASDDLNINFSIFDQNKLEYSADDLLYDVGLIPQMLNPKVYEDLVVKGEQEILIDERIDEYRFHSFYYKTNMLDQPLIIKVSDGFNNIFLPIGGSEVDVFLFGTYSLASILIILFSAILANQISSPIRKLTYATKSVAAGDLSLDLKTEAKGEVKELVSGFQYMIKELRHNQAMLAEIEREEAWKEMAKQVAHEIKNPLTPMKLSVQQLITAYDDKSDKFDNFFKKVTKTILGQIETLKNIATEFSNFARMPKLNVEQINCVEIINQSINLFTDENIDITFNTDLSIALINGDSQELRRTIINLIRNSIQAKANSINFKLSENDKEYNILIKDNGEGIKSEELSKIFEPNFTTKKDGMGLGLSLAKRYLRSTGADISVASSSPEGTTFQIIFPKQ